MLIGTVMTFVFGIAAIIGAVFGCILLSSLLFRDRAARAATKIESKPWKTLLNGVLFGIPCMIISIALFAAPNPLAKILGGLALMAVLFVASVGAGGLVNLVGSRVLEAGGADNRYSAHSKGSILIALACLFPVFGWVLIGPLILIMSMGAGFAVLIRKSEAKETSPEAV
jgi:hypothetical protein